MADIVIDNVEYAFVDKCIIDNKNYIVYENESGIFVSEYFIQNGELKFKNIELSLQKQVLDSLGLDYEL